MAKTNWGRSARACAIVVGVSATVGLMGPAAHAQNGWNDYRASSIEAAKKPPPPPPVSIPGSWVGTIQDSNQGQGDIALTFTEKASKTKGTLKGTWTINFPNGTEGAINDVGTMTGTVVGSDVTITLLPRKADALGNCHLVFDTSEATQQALAGSYHFTSCGGKNTGTISLAPGTPPSTVYINIGDDFFFPTKVTISRGQTVVWTNNGGEQHTINANPGTEKCKPISGEAFDSPAVNPGETFERTFNNPGTFAYHCEIHGCPMKGTIIVK